MTLENKAVISTAVVVDVDASETGNSSRMDSIARRLRDAVESAFSRDASVDPTECLAWDWLNDSDTNFGRCADCNRLVSNYEQPHQIRTLIDARIVDGTLLCDECAYSRREGASADA
ncbi:hypothetical protein K239x_29670 [Planctomycetes bacterium K23_9]|uniref:Uncharacterized protein n=1 Tax=Stieleria marina TaxID=1930275 RepID=A0A517NV25_9BACT|nr:hypothetical protein K239x_29670 [Planctomycetes bacterium K23_9]